MENLKKTVGYKAAEYVEVWYDCRSRNRFTAHYMILALGERVKEGLNIKCVATSLASEKNSK
jgi:ribose 5-phosphate isomerase A